VQEKDRTLPSFALLHIFYVKIH